MVPRSAVSQPPIRVLLVDDDSDDYVLTRALLADGDGSRFQLEWIADFAQATDRMAQNEHDVYLLDYQMGARNGLELLRRARKLGCKAPAIILTGFDDRDLDVEAMEAGASDFLVKGRTDAQLLERSIRYALERSRALAEIEGHRAELSRSNAELEQFASIVSHDLRSPLQVISGYAELLAIRYHDRLDPIGDDYIRRILAGVARQDALISDLLAYARLEGEARPRGPVDLNLAFDTALADLDAAVRTAGAVVTRGHLPTIVGNEVQIGQVFRNLVGNAIKFKRGGTPKVEVSARREGDVVTVTVSDNGPGIPLQSQDRVFRMFQRGPGADQIAGTGIGLAVVKKIVERHGGRIWLESDPGRGATFHFTLPAG